MTSLVWNDKADGAMVATLTPLPKGWTRATCPHCHCGPLTGAIVSYPDGPRVIESADEADPNLLCLNCGWFDD